MILFRLINISLLIISVLFSAINSPPFCKISLASFPLLFRTILDMCYDIFSFFKGRYEREEEIIYIELKEIYAMQIRIEEILDADM